MFLQVIIVDGFITQTQLEFKMGREWTGSQCLAIYESNRDICTNLWIQRMRVTGVTKHQTIFTTKFEFCTHNNFSYRCVIVVSLCSGIIIHVGTYNYSTYTTTFILHNTDAYIILHIRTNFKYRALYTVIVCNSLTNYTY